MTLPYLPVAFLAAASSAFAAMDAAQAQGPPTLGGKVAFLDRSPVASVPVRLLEPRVEGSTDPDGVFGIPLPTDWGPGREVTMIVRLDGYEILKPWDGKLNIPLNAAEKVVDVVIAERRHVAFVHEPTKVARVLEDKFRSDLPQPTPQPAAAPGVAQLEEAARERGLTVEELVNLLAVWKTNAEERGGLYDRALAALYDREYGNAVALLRTDIAADERDIERADSLSQLLPRKHLNLGIGYTGQYDHENAETAYRRAIELDPALTVARFLLATTYYFTSRLIEARDVLRETLGRAATQADSARTMNLLGSVFARRGDLDSALAYYRAALALDQELGRLEGAAIAFYNIARVLGDRALYLGAQADYVAAAAHFDSAYTYFDSLGSPYAAAALQGRRNVRRHQVEAFSEAGLADSVAAVYRAWVAEDPTPAEPMNNLAWHLALRDEHLEEALELSRRSLELEPDNGFYWDTKAEVYFRMARYAEAQEANDTARRFATNPDLIRSIEDRARRIRARGAEPNRKRVMLPPDRWTALHEGPADALIRMRRLSMKGPASPLGRLA